MASRVFLDLINSNKMIYFLFELLSSQQKEALRIAVGGKEGEDSKGRTVMGTDSDLRRLTLKKARDVLRGVRTCG